PSTITNSYAMGATERGGDGSNAKFGRGEPDGWAKMTHSRNCLSTSCLGWRSDAGHFWPRSGDRAYLNTDSNFRPPSLAQAQRLQRLAGPMPTWSCSKRC